MSHTKKRQRRTAREKQRLLYESRARALAAREKYASMGEQERQCAAILLLQRAWWAYKLKKLLPIAIQCMRNARRWTPATLFKMYVSLELQVEAERQARQNWQGVFKDASIRTGDIRALSSSTPPRVVYDKALTEEGFIGFARDLDLLALPFVTHAGLASLFRKHACHMSPGVVLRSRAKGLFGYLCKLTREKVLGKEEIGKLLQSLGLPNVSDQEALSYTFANGTWDLHGFLRYLHDRGWIPSIRDDDLQEIIDYDEWYSSGSQGSGCYTSSSAGLDAYATSSEDDLDSSMSSMSGEAMEQGPLIGMTADGFEKAMKIVALMIRPSGKLCTCEGCRDARLLRTKNVHESPDGVENLVERVREDTRNKESHESWATVRLYFEILAPNAARLFRSKDCAAKDVFCGALFSPIARKALFENDEMLREIFLTLVGRQRDRDKLCDTTRGKGGISTDKVDANAGVQALRADCRNNGFSQTWEQAVVKGHGTVGYFEVLTFCWEYGLHPSVVNSGENNFLLAHLFVGASHAATIRIVPEDEECEHSERESDHSSPKLRCLASDEAVCTWLAERKLDALIWSEDPTVASRVMQLSAGGDKVSAVKVRELVQELNTGLDHSLSPGELYTISREMGRSLRTMHAASVDDCITAQTCLQAVAQTCIFTNAVNTRRLTYGEFTCFIVAMSQQEAGLNEGWRKAALHGTAKQDAVAMGEAMRFFMAKLESVHPLLSKDAVRRQRRRQHEKDSVVGSIPLSLSNGAPASYPGLSCPTLPRSVSTAKRPTRRNVFTALSVAKKMSRFRRRLPTGASQQDPRSSVGTTKTNPTTSQTSPSHVDRDRRSAKIEKSRGSSTQIRTRTYTKVRQRTPYLRAADRGDSVSESLQLRESPSPRGKSYPIGQRFSSKQSMRDSSCCSTGVEPVSRVTEAASLTPSSSDSGSGPDVREAREENNPQVDLRRKLDSILREVFARYAALEPQENVEDNIQATAPVVPPAPLVSMDGLMLFIDDTHVFPMLSFEDIETAVVEEIGRQELNLGQDQGLSQQKGVVADVELRVGLSADEFVRVCLKLMRDNFLVAALGFQHRVRVLNSKEREEEWLKRHLGTTEHQRLLQRLQAWVEHYRLPPRISCFKRDTEAESGAIVGGGRRERKRPSAVASRPGPCLIDMWTGRVVARNPVEADPRCSCKITRITVDDNADREFMEHMDDMIIDMAVPASAPASRASNIDNVSFPGEVKARNHVPNGFCVTRSGAVVASSVGSSVDQGPSASASEIDADDAHSGFITTMAKAKGRHDTDGVSISKGDAAGVIGGEKGTGYAAAVTGVNDDQEPNDKTFGRKGQSRTPVPPATPHTKASKQTGMRGWRSQLNARKMAKRARAHRKIIAQSVGQILSQLHLDEQEAKSTFFPYSEEERMEGYEGGEDSHLPSQTSVVGPLLTGNDYTTLQNSHPSQQLVKAGAELARLNRPEQAVVVLGKATEKLRNVHMVDPRQKLGTILMLSSALERLERFKDVPSLLTEAVEAVYIIAGREQSRRSLKKRLMVATVMGKLGWAYIAAHDFERALETFRSMHESIQVLEMGAKSSSSSSCLSSTSASSAWRHRDRHMERDENSMDSRSPIVSNPPSWRREEMAAIALCWGAKRGTTTALLGLYRGREALLEAEHTVEFANKLSEPAVQAESEGLAGRAWRTIGETIGQDLRRRETYTALKALSARKRKWQERQKKEDEKRTSLSQTNHEVGSEAKADSDGQANGSGSSKNDAANTKLSFLATNLSAKEGVGQTEYNEAPVTTSERPQLEGGQRAEERLVSLRKGARCFRRQLALLNSADRSGPLLLEVEPEVNVYAIALRALMEIGQTALDLGEAEAAVGAFKRRLRLAAEKSQVFLPSSYDAPLKKTLSTSSEPPRKSSRKLSSQTQSFVSTRMAESETTPGLDSTSYISSKKRLGSSKDERCDLDIAETLWWLARATAQYHLGIDLSDYPRFLPFRLHPRGTPVHHHFRPNIPSDIEDKDGDPQLPTVPLPRAESMPSDSLLASSLTICGGRLPKSGRPKIAPLMLQRVRTVRRGPNASPAHGSSNGENDGLRNALVKTMVHSDHCTPGGKFACRSANEGTLPGSTSDTFPDSGCFHGMEGSVVPETSLGVASIAEEADRLLTGGRLWRDSNIGVFLDVRRSAIEGEAQKIATACQPVIEYLRRQLSIAVAMTCDTAGGGMLRRRRRAIIDALMGLGTAAVLCGDDKGGHVLYDRASHCCRLFGEWEGLANTISAKARLHLATGCLEKALACFEYALKLAFELQNEELVVSIHSFLGWTIASQGETEKALGHFRRWRKLACQACHSQGADSTPVAASELCMAHMHLRLASAKRCKESKTNCDNNLYEESAETNGIHNNHLGAAQRHYLRYLHWAEAIQDARGVSHANMCLSHVYEVMGDTEASSRHKNASLKELRRQGDVKNQGRLRAREDEEIVLGMLRCGD
ncbi:unnamed protein product [Ascophyllum nodosum]